MKNTIVAMTLGMMVAGAALPASAQNIRLMTGPQGGSWYPLGGALQGMAAEMDVNMQVLPGGGVANVQGVQGGQADMGFANSISTVDAIKGRKPFTGKADNVCNVATLYPQYFQIVATKKSGIKGSGDFKGKRIVTQPVGNTGEQVTRAVLETAGTDYDGMKSVDYVSYSDGVSLLQDNNADMITMGTTIPASAVMDLANSTDITVVSLDDDFIGKMRDTINPGFTGITIPAGTYPGQDEDVRAVGYATHVIARCDLDPKVVEGLLDQMWTNKEDMAAIAAIMGNMTQEGMAKDVGVPMHEGAKAYYEAQGIK